MNNTAQYQMANHMTEQQVISTGWCCRQMV